MNLNDIGSRLSMLQTQQEHLLDEKHLLVNQEINRGAVVETKILQSLENAQQNALEETFEDISLMFGSHIKDLKQKRSGETTVVSLLEQLSETQKLAGSGIILGDIDSLEKMRDEGKLSDAQVLLTLASWQANKDIGEKKRKRLRDLLDQHIDGNEGWALSLFSQLEIGDMSTDEMKPLMRILQRYRQNHPDEEEQTLCKWFDEIYHWPQREERIRVLLRTFALELSLCIDEMQRERLAATISELKKLLVFLGIEEQSKILAESYNLTSENIMRHILKIAEQIWVDESWVENEINTLSVPAGKKIPFTGKYIDVIKFLPAQCFMDSEQREQIITVAMKYYDHLSQNESFMDN